MSGETIHPLGHPVLAAVLLCLAASTAVAQSEPKWLFSIGAWTGYNIQESNDGASDKSSTLLGPNMRLGYVLTPPWSVYLDLVSYSTMGTSSSDGTGGRYAIGLQHQWDLGRWRPFVGPKIGYISGKGVQDGTVIGPEIGTDFDISSTTFLYARFAYDHDTRNSLDEGIFNGGFGVGLRLQ